MTAREKLILKRLLFGAIGILIVPLLPLLIVGWAIDDMING